MKKELQLRLLPPDTLQEVVPQLGHIQDIRQYVLWLFETGIETPQSLKMGHLESGIYDRETGLTHYLDFEEYVLGDVHRHRDIIKFVLTGEAQNFEDARKLWRKKTLSFFRQIREKKPRSDINGHSPQPSTAFAEPATLSS